MVAPDLEARRSRDVSVVAVTTDRAPVAPLGWHRARLGIDARTLRQLWLVYDATAVQLIRWRRYAGPDVARAMRRAGYQPWRNISGYAIWIRHRAPSRQADPGSAFNKGVSR